MDKRIKNKKNNSIRNFAVANNRSLNIKMDIIMFEIEFNIRKLIKLVKNLRNTIINHPLFNQIVA